MSDNFKDTGIIDLCYKGFSIEPEWLDVIFDHPIVIEKEAGLAQKVEQIPCKD
jgi:hypothetical protein